MSLPFSDPQLFVLCVCATPAGHHTVYVGVHIPKSFHRRRRHRRKSSHKERRERPAERSADDKSDGEVVDEAAISILKPLSELTRCDRNPISHPPPPSPSLSPYCVKARRPSQRQHN